jgi:MSHA biogenesis protein MshJ
MSDMLRNQLKPLADRIDALALRERALLFVTLLAALYMATSTLVLTPLNQKQDRLDRAVKARAHVVTTARLRLEELTRANAGTPSALERQRIDTLQKRLSELDSDLARFTKGLVSPKQMTVLVERLLKENRRLHLVRMESLAPEPLLKGISTSTKAPAPGELQIYRQGIRIEFTGRYVDIVDYLKRLEALPWKFFWGEASLATEKYPISRFTLVLYTVSLDKGWMGT